MYFFLALSLQKLYFLCRHSRLVHTSQAVCFTLTIQYFKKFRTDKKLSCIVKFNFPLIYLRNTARLHYTQFFGTTQLKFIPEQILFVPHYLHRSVFKNGRMKLQSESCVWNTIQNLVCISSGFLIISELSATEPGL